MKRVRRFLFWLLANVNLGRIAPWVLGIALNSRPRKWEK